MDPNGPIATAFPLVARFRPTCLPLPERIQHLTDLAERAQSDLDPGPATVVFNQAALLASDLGLPELASELCTRHSAAQFSAPWPLTAKQAERGLEPLINLARLAARAGDHTRALTLLERLYEAVPQGAPLDYGDAHVPADLTADDADRQHLRAWLWRVLLSDGTRTLTAAGRWHDALAHIHEHKGLGDRMLPGRQVAVVTALTDADPTTAVDLISGTTIGEDWEAQVTGCLHLLCALEPGGPTHVPLRQTVSAYLESQASDGMTLFRTRLGLVLLAAADALPGTYQPRRDLASRLYLDACHANDGYAAQALLASHPCRTQLRDDQRRELDDLVQASGLGSGRLPTHLRDKLDTALTISEHAITSASLHPAG